MAWLVQHAENFFAKLHSELGDKLQPHLPDMEIWIGEVKSAVHLTQSQAWAIEDLTLKLQWQQLDLMTGRRDAERGPHRHQGLPMTSPSID